MIDFLLRSPPRADSARRSCGSDKAPSEPTPIAPIFKKFRRERPSQNRGERLKSVNMARVSEAGMGRENTARLGRPVHCASMENCQGDSCIVTIFIPVRQAEATFLRNRT